MKTGQRPHRARHRPRPHERRRGRRAVAESSATRSCSRPRPAAAARACAWSPAGGARPPPCEAAQSEAQRAFGDSAVYIEKFIENPRHVEMQIFGDTHGNVVHLGRARVLRPAPPPEGPRGGPLRRSSIPTCAAAWARSPCRPPKPPATATPAPSNSSSMPHGNFYFLEMNTRLQVEHPVTELVTGLDLVQLQIRVAAGEPLPFEQQDSPSRPRHRGAHLRRGPGATTSCPRPDASPASRTLRSRHPASTAASTRAGTSPLLRPAARQAHRLGEDRPQVIARLRRALDEYFIGGIQTNLPLFRRILRLPPSRPDTSIPASSTASCGEAPAPNAEAPDAQTPDAQTPDAPTPEAAAIAAVAAVLFAQRVGAASFRAKLRCPPPRLEVRRASGRGESMTTQPITGGPYLPAVGKCGIRSEACR